MAILNVMLMGYNGANNTGAEALMLREYRARLATREKPASVNAALAALQRFYGWARDTGRVRTNPAAKLKPISSQPLAPQGFTPIERQRLRREAERAGPMADAVVTTLLNTGLRVDELVNLMWSDLMLQPRSGRASIRKGKGDKARRVPLNASVRDALRVIQPVPAVGPVFRGKRGHTLTVASGTCWRYSVAALMSRTTTHIDSGTMLPDAWSKRWIYLPLPPCWGTADSTRFGSTPNRMNPHLARAVAALEAH